jgi:hypothetical protein
MKALTSDDDPYRGDIAFKIAAAHAGLASVPGIILSVFDLLEYDIALDLVLQKDAKAMLGTSGLARFIYEMSMMFVMALTFACWRLYKDGPARQPLILFLGGMIKSLFAVQFLRSYMSGDFTVTTCSRSLC